MMPNFPYYMVFYEIEPVKACPHCNGSLGGGITKTYTHASLEEAVSSRNQHVTFQRASRGDPNPDIPYIWRVDSYGQLTRLESKDDPSRCR